MQPIIKTYKLVDGAVLKNGAPIISNIDEVRQYSYILEVFRDSRAMLTISTADIAMGRYEVVDSQGFSKAFSLNPTSSKII